MHWWNGDGHMGWMGIWWIDHATYQRMLTDLKG